MCGLVFTMTGNPIAYNFGNTESFLDQALIAGSFRGWDSTGVSSIGVSKPSGKLKRWFRSDRTLEPGVVYAGTVKWKEYNTGLHDADVIMMHHRAATHGSVSLQNTHPFEINNDKNQVILIGMHNGTVYNWKTLKAPSNIQVDSHAILWAINNTSDPTEVLSKLNGSYTLVWWDYKTDSLYIAKNHLRPLSIVYSHKYNRIWATSESGMLYWLLERNKLLDDKCSKIELKNQTLYQIKKGTVDPDKWIETSYKDKAPAAHNFKPYKSHYKPYSYDNVIEKRWHPLEDTVICKYLTWVQFRNSKFGRVIGQVCIPGYLPVILWGIKESQAKEFEKSGYMVVKLNRLSTAGPYLAEDYKAVTEDTVMAEIAVSSVESISLEEMTDDTIYIDNGKFLSKLIGLANTDDPYWAEVRKSCFNTLSPKHRLNKTTLMNRHKNNAEEYKSEAYYTTVRQTKPKLLLPKPETKINCETDKLCLMGPHSTYISLEKWEELTGPGCGWCSDTFTNDDDVEWVAGDGPFLPLHRDCYKEFTNCFNEVT